MSRPASSWSRITTRVASWNASLCAATLNASSRSRPASWWVNHAGRGNDPTIVVGSSMPRGYHTWRPGVQRVRIAGRRPPRHGQLAVVPLCDGSDPRPHETWHVGPVQLFTVQPVAGQVTLQSLLDPQSTEHDAAC